MKFVWLIYLYIVIYGSSVYAMDFHEYKDYAELLKKYTHQSKSQTLVNYSEIKKNPGLLQKISQQFSKITNKEYESFNQNQKLAFLINAYNVFTIKLIVDNYPVSSIKDIGGFFSSPWKKEFIPLLGIKTHLDQIEHGLIRKKFKEPRIHFAVNCASTSCPPLLREPFLPENLDSQFNLSANIFLKDKEKNYFKDNKLYLSKIFDWYGKDFKEMSGKSFKEFINPYFPDIDTTKVDIHFLKYDWSLNEYKK